MTAAIVEHVVPPEEPARQELRIEALMRELARLREWLDRAHQDLDRVTAERYRLAEENDRLREAVSLAQRPRPPALRRVET